MNKKLPILILLCAMFTYVNAQVIPSSIEVNKTESEYADSKNGSRAASLSVNELSGNRAVPFDFGVNNIDLDAYPNMISAPYLISGRLTNYGSTTITAFTLNYKINGGATVATPVSFVNITANSIYNYNHAVDWNPGLSGMYDVKVWASDLNGNPDQYNLNDTAYSDVIVSDSIPNIVDTYLNGQVVSTVIGTSSDQLDKPMDLDFHPDLSRNELWVISMETESFGGTTVIYSNTGKSNQTDIYRKDANSWHFMSLPTGMAFSTNGNWANSPGVFDANHNGGAPFTGPSLWSSDLAIYAQPSGGNGSHLDMLHESPRSMGIASETKNVFWVYDSHNGDIVRYDFVDDHGPGNSFHADGIIRRYPVPVSVINYNIACHMDLDRRTDWLYIVDGGNQKILRLDINSGFPAGTPTAPQYEPLAEYTQMAGIVYQTVVDSGLVQPSGIDIVGNRMIVSDHANGDIVIYDISVNPVVELGRISTGSVGIQGVKVGPEGDIFYVNSTLNQLVKLQSVVAVNELNDVQSINIFPSPSTGIITVQSNSGSLIGNDILIVDMLGKTVFEKYGIDRERIELDLRDLSDGIYSLMSVGKSTGVSFGRVVLQK